MKLLALRASQAPCDLQDPTFLLVRRPRPCAGLEPRLTFVQSPLLSMDHASATVPSRPQAAEACSGIRAMTLISKSKPASQLTPTAVQFG